MAAGRPREGKWGPRRLAPPLHPSPPAGFSPRSTRQRRAHRPHTRSFPSPPASSRQTARRYKLTARGCASPPPSPTPATGPARGRRVPTWRPLGLTPPPCARARERRRRDQCETCPREPPPPPPPARRTCPRRRVPSVARLVRCLGRARGPVRGCVAERRGGCPVSETGRRSERTHLGHRRAARPVLLVHLRWRVELGEKHPPGSQQLQQG